MAIAKVIIDVSLDKEFDYLIPETLLPQIKVGVMVRVPFGHSTREGYVLSLADSSDYTGGNQTLLDRGGRVSRFNAKFGAFTRK